MTNLELKKWLREAAELAHRRTVRLDQEGDWVCWECMSYWGYYDPPVHTRQCRLAAVERAAGFDPKAARPGNGTYLENHYHYVRPEQ